VAIEYLKVIFRKRFKLVRRFGYMAERNVYGIVAYKNTILLIAHTTGKSKRWGFPGGRLPLGESGLDYVIKCLDRQVGSKFKRNAEEPIDTKNDSGSISHVWYNCAYLEKPTAIFKPNDFVADIAFVPLKDLENSLDEKDKNAMTPRIRQFLGLKKIDE